MRRPRRSSAVYVASQLVMFGTSAAFHRIRWSASAWRRMRRADHSAIFVGIAGTCDGRGRAVADRMGRDPGPDPGVGRRRAGIALRQVWLDAPQWVVAIPYVVVGWCPIVVAPQLVRGLGWAGFALCSWPGWSTRRAHWSTPASVRTRGHGSSASTRCSTPARWSGPAMFAYVVAFIALPRY